VVTDDAAVNCTLPGGLLELLLAVISPVNMDEPDITVTFTEWPPSVEVLMLPVGYWRSGGKHHIVTAIIAECINVQH